MGANNTCSAMLYLAIESAYPVTLNALGDWHWATGLIHNGREPKRNTKCHDRPNPDSLDLGKVIGPLPLLHDGAFSYLYVFGHLGVSHRYPVNLGSSVCIPANQC